MTDRLRNSVSALCICGAAAFPVSAFGQENPPINIPSQPLQEALDALSRQTGVRVVTTKPVIEGVRSSPVQGAATPSEALSTMLTGTRLSQVEVGVDSFAVTRNFVSQDNADPDAFDLGVLVLQGDRLGRELEDISPSTSVISGVPLETASNGDLDAVINDQPNVFNPEGGFLPTIRGIDGTGVVTRTGNAGNQPRVPIVIDGVPTPYFPASSLTRPSTWDRSSVEVARGPQPTSTGRNAIGGAIRLFSNLPTFDREGAVRLSYHNQQDTGGFALMLNMPLIEDQLAFRLTAEISEGEAYIDSITPIATGIDVEGESLRQIRGQLLYEPLGMPGLSWHFSFDRTLREQALEGIATGNPEDFTLTNFPFFNQAERNEQNIYSTRLQYDLGNGSEIVGRLAYLENDFSVKDVGFGTGFFGTELAEAEVYYRFGQIGIIDKGVIGIIRSIEDEAGFGEVGAGTPLYDVDGQIENSALYGEVEISGDWLAPGLTFIAGGRLERDVRTRFVTSFIDGSVVPSSFEATEFLPKLGLRYDLQNGTTLGYSYSRGFRNGGAEVDVGAPFAGVTPIVFAVSPYEAEFIDQHEIYARFDAMNGALSIDATAFYNDFTNAQVAGASQVLNAFGQPMTGNIPEAISYGLELAATYRATDRLSFQGSLGLLETEIKDAGPVLAAFNGAELPRSPNKTASLGVAWDAGNGWDFAAQARFTDSQKTLLTEPELSSFTVVDAQLGYDFDTNDFGSLRLEGYVQNLFDQTYLLQDEAVPSLPGTNALIVGRPRTIGISLTARF